MEIESCKIVNRTQYAQYKELIKFYFALLCIRYFKFCPFVNMKTVVAENVVDIVERTWTLEFDRLRLKSQFPLFSAIFPGLSLELCFVC